MRVPCGTTFMSDDSFKSSDLLGQRRFDRVRSTTLRSLLFKGTNFCVFCDLEKFAKFKDRKIYAACASGAALYSMRTLRAR